MNSAAKTFKTLKVFSRSFQLQFYRHHSNYQFVWNVVKLSLNWFRKEKLWGMGKIIVSWLLPSVVSLALSPIFFSIDLYKLTKHERKTNRKNIAIL